MKNYLFIGAVSIIITTIIGYFCIPLLKKLKIGQPILKYVEIHNEKSGTPTMGGLFFIIPPIILFILSAKGEKGLSILSIAIILAFMIVGFIDDFLKIKGKDNQGLTATQKIIFQTSIALISAYFSYRSGLDFAYLPFTKTKINLGYFAILLNTLVFIATVNSVNLTDGLDGLCGSVSAVVLLSLSIITIVQLNGNSDIYLNKSEYLNLTLLAVALVGGILAFLLFNVNKAKVFMGDTGSLALGGAVSAIAIFSGNTLYIPIIGICYLLSSLSVIIQVFYYKKTKRRVFLMAPIHHHFQQKGLSEGKICYGYTFVTILISLFCIYSQL